VGAGDFIWGWVAREGGVRKRKAESGGNNVKFQNPNDKGQRTKDNEWGGENSVAVWRVCWVWLISKEEWLTWIEVLTTSATFLISGARFEEFIRQTRIASDRSDS
jgi:hypothetical protein